MRIIFFTILRKCTYFILENSLKNESTYIINSVLFFFLVKTLTPISVNIFLKNEMSVDTLKNLYARYSKVEC